MPFRNTGEQEERFVDTNPDSLSFGLSAWRSIGVNTNACPIPAANQTEFFSDEIRETVYRSDCGEGYIAKGTVYVVEQGRRTSLVSREDANRLARAEFEAGKEAYAIQFDSCELLQSEDLFTCEYDINGCWTGNVIINGIADQYTNQGQYDRCYTATQDGGPAGIQPCPAL